VKRAFSAIGLGGLILPLGGCVGKEALLLLLLLPGLFGDGAGLALSEATLDVGQTAELALSANAPGGQRLRGIEVSPLAGDSLSFDPALLRVESVSAIPPWSLDAAHIDNVQGRVTFIARVPPPGPYPRAGEVLRIAIKGMQAGSTQVQLSATHVANGDNLPLALDVRGARVVIR